MSGYQTLGLVTLVGVLIVIVLGGTVRVTDSGLACPDWPLCNGRLIPSGDYHIWIEWTHRLMAGVVGLLIVAMAARAWLRYRDRPWIVLTATLAVVVLGAQVVLGGLTVTENLPTGIVSAHLGTAMIIVLLLAAAWLATFASERDSAAAHSVPGSGAVTARLAIVAGIGLFSLILVGAVVSTSEAGFACGGWPHCNGALLPEGGAAGLHMAHRYLAAAAGLVFLATAVAAWRQRQEACRVAALAGLALALYLTQTLLGAANIWTGLAAWARVSHLAVAAALWGVTVGLAALMMYRAGWTPWVGQRGALPKPFPLRLRSDGRPRQLEETEAREGG